MSFENLFLLPLKLQQTGVSHMKAQVKLFVDVS